MKTIAIVKATGIDGDQYISPVEPFPTDALAIVCDGEKYTIYQAGDILPETSSTTEE